MNKAKRRRPSAPTIIVIVVLIGLLLVGAANAWQVWGTTLLARQGVDQRVATLRDSFASAPAPKDDTPLVGQPVMGKDAWVLRIDKLGLAWPIVAGVDDTQLASGVGWYPSSARPGQVGNCVVAGQRITHGEPFARLLDLAVGDTVSIETDVATFTYTITLAPADLTVTSGDSWVLDPVPGKPEQEPAEALLTLTTAEDLFPTADRSVGFATLTSTEPR